MATLIFEIIAILGLMVAFVVLVVIKSSRKHNKALKKPYLLDLEERKAVTRAKMEYAQMEVPGKDSTDNLPQLSLTSKKFLEELKAKADGYKKDKNTEEGEAFDRYQKMIKNGKLLEAIIFAIGHNYSISVYVKEIESLADEYKNKGEFDKESAILYLALEHPMCEPLKSNLRKRLEFASKKVKIRIKNFNFEQ